MRVLFYFTIAQECTDSKQTEEDTSDESSRSVDEVSEEDNKKLFDHYTDGFHNHLVKINTLFLHYYYSKKSKKKY